MKTGRSFREVLDILQSESRSLKTLAYMSGYDPFEFYRSADLRGLDLSTQDLTGLNFDHADLRGCKLADISYDVGAFNNSRLPNETPITIDEYDSYFSDFLENNIKRIYIFSKVRPGTIDRFVSLLGMSYGEFSVHCGISEATLRKTRRSEPVSVETAQSLVSALNQLSERVSPSESSFIRQPSICFLKSRPEGGFAIIPRDQFLRYMTIADRLYTYRKERPYPTYMEGWRDGPSMLDWYEIHFFGGDAPLYGDGHLSGPPAELDFGLFAPRHTPDESA